MDETWRDVPGFLGYQASNQGRVRSIDRHIEHSNGITHRLKGRLIRPRLSSMGYPQLKIGRRYVTVHSIVLLAFVGPPPAGCEAAHNNGDRSDASLANLRYATHQENVADKIAHGTHQAGERHAMARLTADEVRKMRSEAGSMSDVDLARKYGIGKTQALRIVCGELWRDAGGPTRDRRVHKKVSDDQADRIRALRGSAPFTEIAALFGISQAQVSRIMAGRR